MFCSVGFVWLGSTERFTVKLVFDEKYGGRNLTLNSRSRTLVYIFSIISFCRALLQSLWEIKSTVEFDLGVATFPIGIVDSCKPCGGITAV